LRACDAEIERLLAGCASQADPAALPPPPPNAPRGKGRKNQLVLPQTDLRAELFRLYGTDLTQCPALGLTPVATLFAEVGADLSRFPTAKHFASWLGLCPDPRKTGGRVVRHQTREVQHRVAKAFRLAAQSLHHSHTILGVYYRRMRAKLGGPGAVTATAHKLARLFYHLVTTREAYDETVFQRLEEQHQQRQLHRLKRQAQRLGYTLTPTPCVS
jgi:hypothetical protein